MERDEKEGSMKMKKRIPMFVAMALLAGMIALNVCVKEPEEKADKTFRMVNTNISWQQTYYPGSWDLVERP